MVKNVVSKALWMGRAAIFVVGLAVILAITVGLGTTALAAAPGDPFKLGKYNSVDKITRLIGSAPGAMLRIDNNGAGAALDLNVEDANAPMTVNSDAKVANLNADTVDGLSSDDLRGQQGEKGDQGESVTNTDIPADPNNENCTNGGSKFTSVSGETFACTGDTGPAGVDGEDGAPGADGENGEDGANGATGPRGPSNVYADVPNDVEITTSNVTVASVALPAGSYLVTTTMGLSNPSTSQFGLVRCALQPNQDSVFYDASLEPVASSNSSSATLTFTQPVSLAVGGNVSISCSNFVANEGTINGRDIFLSAMQTGSLSRQ